MSYFVKATPAPTPKSKNTVVVSIFLASILFIMVVAQLLSYDKFIPLLGSYELPLTDVGVGVLAGLIVFCEVLALPFLLRMKLSPAMRVFSMVAGWLVVGIWLLIQLQLNHPLFLTIGAPSVMNVGLFGASVQLTVGWWSVCFVAALGVLSAWAAWGLWPFGHHRK